MDGGILNSYEIGLDECYNDNVTVVEKRFKSKAKGLWKNNVIGISKDIDTIAERNCILAEEHGHFKTTVGNILDLNNINNLKQENKARAVAIEKLCSLKKIVEAVKKGAINRYEVAHYLDITDQFFDDAIEYHKRKQGLCCECDGFLIYFEPCFGILRNDVF